MGLDLYEKYTLEELESRGVNTSLLETEINESEIRYIGALVLNKLSRSGSPTNGSGQYVNAARFCGIAGLDLSGLFDIEGLLEEVDFDGAQDFGIRISRLHELKIDEIRIARETVSAGSQVAEEKTTMDYEEPQIDVEAIKPKNSSPRKTKVDPPADLSTKVQEIYQTTKPELSEEPEEIYQPPTRAKKTYPTTTQNPVSQKIQHSYCGGFRSKLVAIPEKYSPLFKDDKRVNAPTGISPLDHLLPERMRSGIEIDYTPIAIAKLTKNNRDHKIFRSDTSPEKRRSFIDHHVAEEEEEEDWSGPPRDYLKKTFVQPNAPTQEPTTESPTVHYLPWDLFQENLGWTLSRAAVSNREVTLLGADTNDPNNGTVLVESDRLYQLVQGDTRYKEICELCPPRQRDPSLEQTLQEIVE